MITLPSFSSYFTTASAHITSRIEDRCWLNLLLELALVPSVLLWIWVIGFTVSYFTIWGPSARTFWHHSVFLPIKTQILFPLWMSYSQDQSNSFAKLIMSSALPKPVRNFSMESYEIVNQKEVYNHCQENSAKDERKDISNESTVHISLTSLPREILIELYQFSDIDPLTLMKVNKYLFDIFAPIAYQNIHCIFSIGSTVRTIMNDESYLFSSSTRRCSIWNLRDYYENIYTLEEKIEDTDYDVYKRYKMASANDFELPNVSWSWKDCSRKQKGVNFKLVEDPQTILFICSNIINNQNSIMRPFIKNLTIDVLFLDQRYNEENLLSNLLEKYCIDSSCISTKLGKIQLATNYKWRPEDGSNRMWFFWSNNSLERLLSDKDIDIFRTFVTETIDDCSVSIRCTVQNIVSRKLYAFYEELFMLSQLFQFIMDGRLTRMKIMHSKTPEELRTSLECLSKFSVGEDLVQYNALDRLPQEVELLHEKVWKITKHEVEDKLIPGASYFASALEIENLLEEIIKAMTIKSPEHTNTSLTVVGLGNNNIKTKDDFVAYEPEFTVINRLASN